MTFANFPRAMRAVPGAFWLLTGWHFASTTGLGDHTSWLATGEFCFQEPPFAQCHASTVLEIKPGTLLAAYFAGEREGAKNVAIWLSRGQRRNGTWHWEPPRLAHREPNTPCWNPVLATASGGSVLLFFKAGPSPETWSGFLRRSKDEGSSWSEAAILPAGIVGPVRSKPIRAANGALICGSSHESYKAWTCWVDVTGDDGATWRKHGPIAVPGHPFGIIQPSVFSIQGDHIGLLARTRGLGKVARAESRDGGVTWTNATLIDVPNPNAGLDAVRLREGPLWLIYNDSPNRRTPLVVGESKDDGQTFVRVVTLESEPGEYSYPALIQSTDGEVHATYTYQRRFIKHVTISREP